MADAVSCPVQIILPQVPQVAPRQHVQLRASRARGESRCAEVDHSFQYRRIVPFLCFGRPTEVVRPGDVRRAVRILAAAVDQ